MDTGWLQDFMVLAETGSFTRAAAIRNISQAAFSRRMQALESWAGVMLIDRSTHPARLTAEGERFHAEMADTLHRLIDVRTALSRPAYYGKAQVRIALPHVLAGSRFSRWWKDWAHGTGMFANAMIGNVTDIVASFVAGGADILVCHHGKELPLVLDPKLFMRCTVERDVLRPFYNSQAADLGALEFPGTEANPLPLLMYSKGAYFARLVDMIVDQAPAKLHADLRVEAPMSDVLRDCAAKGLGVAWLPQCAIHGDYEKLLTPVREECWSMDLDIVAFAHRAPRSPAAEQMWNRITAGAVAA